MTLPTNPTIHPLNHTPTYRWSNLQRFQIFKQNQIILIRKFYCIFSDLGLPALGEGVGGWDIWGHEGAPRHMHAHAHPPHTYVQHANKHGTHEGSHLQFLYMYILA